MAPRLGAPPPFPFGWEGVGSAPALLRARFWLRCGGVGCWPAGPPLPRGCGAYRGLCCLLGAVWVGGPFFGFCPLERAGGACGPAGVAFWAGCSAFGGGCPVSGPCGAERPDRARPGAPAPLARPLLPVGVGWAFGGAPRVRRSGADAPTTRRPRGAPPWPCSVRRKAKGPPAASASSARTG